MSPRAERELYEMGPRTYQRDLSAEYETLQRRHRKALVLLQSMEWATRIGGALTPRCFACRALQAQGHHKDCELAEALNL